MDEKFGDKISLFYRKNKRMPTYAEIADIFGYKSKNAVFRLVKKLKDRGLIEQDEKGRLIPKNLFGEMRMLGVVEAGFPSPAEEELLDTITLDEWLVENKESTYLLTVKGDSMKDAGIISGDLAIVERTDKCKPGDIVIAFILSLQIRIIKIFIPKDHSKLLQ
jgi:SOS-response transcriptional repressor LexA